MIRYNTENGLCLIKVILVKMGGMNMATNQTNEKNSLSTQQGKRKYTLTFTM